MLNLLQEHYFESEVLKAVPIVQMGKGDFLVYINPKYNPDVTAQKGRGYAGSHVAIVHAVVQSQKVPLVYTISVMDASLRRTWRSFSAGKNIRESEFKIAPTEQDPHLWICEIPGLKTSPKYLYAFRILSSLSKN